MNWLIIGILFITACSNNDSNLDEAQIVDIEIPVIGKPYAIVDTGTKVFYSDNSVISIPAEGQIYYGQDATYNGNEPSYTNNGDGTITDNVTGLMWEQSMGEKITFDEAFTKANASTLGNYNDWRVPTLKEMYSLILFTGSVKGAVAIDFFIDTNYFNQPLGDTSIGEREIDAQTWTSTQYVGLTMYAGDCFWCQFC
ncbi:DUF1566 domain-containing protein [Lutibacter sp. HS1-25]|uniref:Lcl C-terminal domain-containing protein n=1 Tax=Lutibacter sp. HS1-25 TaxID=2485000 RepID=UPI00197C7EDC|nr:DUF1566 domain-containing protein [Lutibacter sp. HS1-25]